MFKKDEAAKAGKQQPQPQSQPSSSQQQKQQATLPVIGAGISDKEQKDKFESMIQLVLAQDPLSNHLSNNNNNNNYPLIIESANVAKNFPAQRKRISNMKQQQQQQQQQQFSPRGDMKNVKTISPHHPSQVIFPIQSTLIMPQKTLKNVPIKAAEQKSVAASTIQNLTPRMSIMNQHQHQLSHSQHHYQKHSTISSHIKSVQNRVLDKKKSSRDFHQSYPQITHNHRVNTQLITSPVVTTMRKAQQLQVTKPIPQKVSRSTLLGLSPGPPPPPVQQPHQQHINKYEALLDFDAKMVNHMHTNDESYVKAGCGEIKLEDENFSINQEHLLNEPIAKYALSTMGCINNSCKEGGQIDEDKLDEMIIPIQRTKTLTMSQNNGSALGLFENNMKVQQQQSGGGEQQQQNQVKNSLKSNQKQQIGYNYSILGADELVLQGAVLENNKKSRMHANIAKDNHIIAGSQSLKVQKKSKSVLGQDIQQVVFKSNGGVQQLQNLQPVSATISDIADMIVNKSYKTSNIDKNIFNSLADNKQELNTNEPLTTTDDFERIISAKIAKINNGTPKPSSIKNKQGKSALLSQTQQAQQQGSPPIGAFHFTSQAQNNQQQSRQNHSYNSNTNHFEGAIFAAAASEQPIFPVIRQGSLFKEQQTKTNLLNIFSTTVKHDSAVLSSSTTNPAQAPSTTAIQQAFSQVPQQIHKMHQKENELLSKIEKEIFRRQANQQINQATLSPPWNSKEPFGPMLSSKKTQSVVKRQQALTQQTQQLQFSQQQEPISFSKSSLAGGKSQQRFVPLQQITQPTAQQQQPATSSLLIPASHHQKAQLASQQQQPMSDYLATNKQSKHKQRQKTLDDSKSNATNNNNNNTAAAVANMLLYPRETIILNGNNGGNGRAGDHHHRSSELALILPSTQINHRQNVKYTHQQLINDQQQQEMTQRKLRVQYQMASQYQQSINSPSNSTKNNTQQQQPQNVGSFLKAGKSSKQLVTKQLDVSNSSINNFQSSLKHQLLYNKGTTNTGTKLKERSKEQASTSRQQFPMQNKNNSNNNRTSNKNKMSHNAFSGGGGQTTITNSVNNPISSGGSLVNDKIVKNSGSPRKTMQYQSSNSRIDQILNFSNIDEIANITTTAGSSTINLMQQTQQHQHQYNLRAAQNIQKAAILHTNRGHK